MGYSSYVELIADLTEGKEVISSSMLQEVRRCEKALRIANSGKVVSLVSSGDPGVYGMAVEQAARLGLNVSIEIVAGISASNCAASRLGAPLMLYYATISLSDLLVPWEQIARRLLAVAQANHGLSAQEIENIALEQVDAIVTAAPSRHHILIPNVAGSGIVPATKVGRILRDLQDLVNQRVSSHQSRSSGYHGHGIGAERF